MAELNTNSLSHDLCPPPPGKSTSMLLNGWSLQARDSEHGPLHICVNISESGVFSSSSSGGNTRLDPPPKRHQFPFLSLPVELRHMIYGYLCGEAAYRAEMDLADFRKTQKRNKDPDSKSPLGWTPSSTQLLGTQNYSRDLSPQELAIAIRQYGRQLLAQVNILSASKAVFHDVRYFLHTIPLRLHIDHDSELLPSSLHQQQLTSDADRRIIGQLEILTARKTLILDLPTKQILTVHDQISGTLISYLANMWRETGLLERITVNFEPEGMDMDLLDHATTDGMRILGEMLNTFFVFQRGTKSKKVDITFSGHASSRLKMVVEFAQTKGLKIRCERDEWVREGDKRLHLKALISGGSLWKNELERLGQLQSWNGVITPSLYV